MAGDDLLDNQTPHLLITEIRELIEQYILEVSTSHRTCPRSIKERVVALQRLGIDCHKIAGFTEVPEPIVPYWCKPEASKLRDRRRRQKEWDAKNLSGKFLPVIPSSEVQAVGSPKSVTSEGTLPITVSLPVGIKVKGVTLAELIELLRAVRS